MEIYFGGFGQWLSLGSRLSLVIAEVLFLKFLPVCLKNSLGSCWLPG